MARKAKSDLAAEIMDRVLSQPIPANGELKHPIQPGVRQGQKRQASIADISNRNTSGLPEDIESWTTRNLTEYFKQSYQTTTGGNYRPGVIADAQAFKQCGAFFHSNGLPRVSCSKRLIDWGMHNFARIKTVRGAVTPQALLAMINEFYQDEILPAVEAGTVEREENDTWFLDEIQEAFNQGRSTELFSRFGIPVTMTYLSIHQGFSVEKLVTGITDRFAALMKGTPQDRQTLERVFEASVLGSPYPAEFEGLDWRDRFHNLVRPFMDLRWYRAEDYKGKPLPKYRHLYQPRPSAEKSE